MRLLDTTANPGCRTLQLPVLVLLRARCCEEAQMAVKQADSQRGFLLFGRGRCTSPVRWPGDIIRRYTGEAGACRGTCNTRYCAQGRRAAVRRQQAADCAPPGPTPRSTPACSLLRCARAPRPRGHGW